MSHTPRDPHLSVERLQAFLDGGLPNREMRRAEEHLGRCARCASEAEGWRSMFEELDALPRLVPHEGFQSRVMAQVELPTPLSLAARVRAFVTRLAPSLPGRGHPPAGDLQDLAEGSLPARAEARLLGHVDGCGGCARELATWRSLVGELNGLGHLAPREDFSREVMATWRLEQQLDSLGHLAPSSGFAARVMEGVRIPAPAPARVPAASPATAWNRLLAAARGLVPQTRRAWAALSGVAVTPVVTVGLVLWAVFSHPTLTPSALASFAWWKTSELAVGAWGTLSGLAMESAGVFRLWEALGSLFGDPGTLAAVGLAFAAGSLVSLWVLYKNLVATHTVDGRYAHAHF